MNHISPNDSRLIQNNHKELLPPLKTIDFIVELINEKILAENNRYKIEYFVSIDEEKISHLHPDRKIVLSYVRACCELFEEAGWKIQGSFSNGRCYYIRFSKDQKVKSNYNFILY